MVKSSGQYDPGTTPWTQNHVRDEKEPALEEEHVLAPEELKCVCHDVHRGGDQGQVDQVREVGHEENVQRFRLDWPLVHLEGVGVRPDHGGGRVEGHSSVAGIRNTREDQEGHAAEGRAVGSQEGVIVGCAGEDWFTLFLAYFAIYVRFVPVLWKPYFNFLEATLVLNDSVYSRTLNTRRTPALRIIHFLVLLSLVSASVYALGRDSAATPGPKEGR